MSKQYSQTGKKALLTDFFSILAFALLIIIFYLMFRFTVGNTTFQLHSESSEIQDAVSLLGILRTKIEIDSSQMTIAELAALSKTDEAKKKMLEKDMSKIIGEFTGCAIFCIDDDKIVGKNCNMLERNPCPEFEGYIPGYAGPIKVSFISDSQPEKNIP